MNELLPDDATVLAWWRCGRKQRLVTESVAALASAPYAGTSHYPCGDHWHFGRTPAAGRWTLKHARREWLQTAGSQGSDSPDNFAHSAPSAHACHARNALRIQKDSPKMPGEPKRVQPSRNNPLTSGNVIPRD